MTNAEFMPFRRIGSAPSIDKTITYDPASAVRAYWADITQEAAYWRERSVRAAGYGNSGMMGIGFILAAKLQEGIRVCKAYPDYLQDRAARLDRLHLLGVMAASKLLQIDGILPLQTIDTVASWPKGAIV